MEHTQLTYWESMRDIEATFSAQTSKLYHMEFRELIWRSTLAGAFFVAHAKSNLKAHRAYTAQVECSVAILCDQTNALYGFYSKRDYHTYLRWVASMIRKQARCVFPSNQMNLPATNICVLFKDGWQTKQFVKWIKLHLRIKQFFGTSENAVKKHIWIVVSDYLLAAIVRKNLDNFLCSLLRISSLTLYDKIPLQQSFQGSSYCADNGEISNHLNLFKI